MKKNIILKEASILIFISLITLSTIVASGYTNNLQVENGNDFHFRCPDVRGNVVWDNDMSYSDFWYAVWDEVNNVDFTTADDYIFTDNVVLNGVKWIGGYTDSNYQQGNFDWAIVFYDDDGSRNAPGLITNYFLFTPTQYDKALIEDTGYAIWYEYSVELPDTIYFQANTKYWIAYFGVGELIDSTPIVGLHDSILLHCSVVGSNYWGIPYWTDFNCDICFQLIESSSDLQASGSLSWSGVKPGDVVKGSFEVDNIGEDASLLDWEITEQPEWGTWIFEPEEGEDLTPEDGTLIINVTVIAPEEAKKDFSGHLTLINLDDPTDFDIIDVTLSTPKNKQVNFKFPLLSWLFERFPNIFPVLRYLVGL